MIKDKSMPLYTITIGEFIELTRQAVTSILSENENGQSATSTEDEHLTLSECATFLRCSLVSLHKYKKHGLPYYKIGRKVLFKKSEVLAFMKTAGKRLRTLCSSK